MSTARKVLVVDDDPIVGKSFNRVLAAKGYAVITAQNGEEALEKLGAEKYDLVFTDIKMPGICGLEVAEQIKASQPWLPVVIITGYATPGYQDRAVAAGVAGFLNKPLSPEMIEISASLALKAGDDVAVGAAPAVAAPPVATPVAAAPVASLGRNFLMLLAAPVIGLAFIAAMPVLGLFGLLALIAGVVGEKFGGAAMARQVGLAAAGGLLGLAFVVALPVAGLGAMTWMGAKAALQE